MAYVVTFFSTALFLERLLFYIFFRVTISTQQLLFGVATSSEQLLFLMSSFSRTVASLQQLFCFRITAFSEQNFYRAASS